MDKMIEQYESSKEFLLHRTKKKITDAQKWITGIELVAVTKSISNLRKRSDG